MLNQRQSFILKDLEAAKEPITAKALAAKYNISLRTIRNDINEISDYVNTLLKYQVLECELMQNKIYIIN